MPEGISFVCPDCNQTLPAADRAVCPDCETVYNCVYDIETVRERFDPATQTRTDLWRYSPLLPVTGENPVTLGEGWTDLLTAPKTGGELGVELELKVEGENPTGSAKDRGSAAVATHARTEGYDEVVCASTGNAAASIAAYAARGGLDCSLFVPERLPDAKAVQPLVYGASLRTVEGGYGLACEQCKAYAGNEAVLDRSAGENPFTAAGGRTLGFELAEQTESPDWIAISMGNGGTIADLWGGFELFDRLGYVSETPRLLGVQAAAAPAIHEAVESDTTADPAATRETCADSIDVDQPNRKADAKRAIEESAGASITVTDDQIRRALRQLGKNEGVFVEPASAAAVAGVDAALSRGLIDHGERVVAVMTGNGLKDPESALEAVHEGN